jgi:hypothetical protein
VELVYSTRLELSSAISYEGARAICGEMDNSVYVFRANAPIYVVNNVSVLPTGAGGPSRWIGVSGRGRYNYHLSTVPPKPNVTVRTFLELQALPPAYENFQVYCVELQTVYSYFYSLPNVYINNISVIAVSGAPNSRWIGISGSYVYKNIDNLDTKSIEIGDGVTDGSGNIDASLSLGNVGSIEVFDEGSSIGTSIHRLNIVGPDVQATLVGPNEVSIGHGAGVPAFSITGFSNNHPLLEKGQGIGPTGTYPSLTFNWTYSPGPPDTSQSINNGVGAVTGLTKVFSPVSDITSNITYTLTAVNNMISYNATTSVNFQVKRYWGVSASDDPIGSATNTYGLLSSFLDSVNEEFATTRQTTKTFDCSLGRYFYFFFPSSFGTVDPQLQIGPFPVSLAYTGVITGFTNQSGHSEDYRVYRSDNILFDSVVTVTVL